MQIMWNLNADNDNIEPEDNSMGTTDLIFICVMAVTLVGLAIFVAGNALKSVLGL